MKILITGATGLIGRKLSLQLFKSGHDLVIISRSKKKAMQSLAVPAEIVEGDLLQGPVQALPKVDAVVHLLGEGVAEKRWSESQKQKLRDSRILGTKNLLASLNDSVKVMVSASAIGFYGDRPNEVLGENSSAGTGFLSELCQAWEQELKLQPAATRSVIFRIGIVLAKDGGALDEMCLPFRIGVGGALGSGKQMMSWIHIEDLISAFQWALETESVAGVINGVSEKPVTNLQFSRALATQLKRHLGPKVPTVALKILFGELSQVLLSDQNVISRLSSLGFHFKYSDLENALRDLLSEEANGEEVMLAQQFVPYSIDKVFRFFCDANNLERITPKNLNFHIDKMSTNEIGQGTLIDYSLKIRGVPVKWQTLIDEWAPPRQFVDTQLKGPYSLWHHTHKFESVRGGTLMTDRVRYKVPLGYLGWVASRKFVKEEVKNIFSYRKNVISEIQDEIFAETAAST